MLLLLFACTFAYSAAAQEIVNGTDADPGEFPFMISLRNFTRHTCGGTIVNANYVLTAAHCVCYDYASPVGLSIQYGVLEISQTNESSIQVEEIICHESYDPDLLWANDVAVLRLQSPIPANRLYTTRLAPSDFDTSSSQNGTVIGWGRLWTNGTLPEILQKVDIVVYSNEICDNAYNGLIDLVHHICAGVPENGKGSCQGDSGGPLLIGDIQVGVVSWGTGGNCGISNTTNPKALARVSSYTDWIIAQTSAASNVKFSSFVTGLIVAFYIGYYKS